MSAPSPTGNFAHEHSCRSADAGEGMLNENKQSALACQVIIHLPGLTSSDHLREGKKPVVIQYIDPEYSCASNIPADQSSELINPFEKLKASCIRLDLPMPQAGLFDPARRLEPLLRKVDPQEHWKAVTGRNDFRLRLQKVGPGFGSRTDGPPHGRYRPGLPGIPAELTKESNNSQMSPGSGSIPPNKALRSLVRQVWLRGSGSLKVSSCS